MSALKTLHIMLKKEHKITAGADFQNKTVSATIGASRVVVESQATREELTTSSIKAGCLPTPKRETVKTNAYEWLESKLPEKPLVSLCTPEKFNNQDRTEGSNECKLEQKNDRSFEKHAKPHQQKGNKLKNWHTKCFERRKLKRTLEAEKDAIHHPWKQVERSKIKLNSMLRFGTWNVRTLKSKSNRI